MGPATWELVVNDGKVVFQHVELSQTQAWMCFFWQNIRGQGLCNRVVKTQSDQHIQSSLRAPIAEWILVIVHFKVHRLDQRQHYAIPTILTGDIVLTTSCNYPGGKFLATYGDINCQNPSISQRLEPTSQTVETFVGSTVVLILVVFMVFRTRLPPVRSRALTGSFNCPAESRQLRNGIIIKHP